MIRTLLHENSDTLRIIPIWDKPKLAFYDIIFYWSSRLKGRTGQEQVISYIYIYNHMYIYIYTYVYVNAGKSHGIILCNVCIYIYLHISTAYLNKKNIHDSGWELCDITGFFYGAEWQHQLCHLGWEWKNFWELAVRHNLAPPGQKPGWGVEGGHSWNKTSAKVCLNGKKNWWGSTLWVTVCERSQQRL